MVHLYASCLLWMDATYATFQSDGNLTNGNIVIDNTLQKSKDKQCSDFEQFYAEIIYICHFSCWFLLWSDIFQSHFVMLLYKVASFFCPGWPVYTGLAVMQFPDLKNESEQIKSWLAEQMYQLLLLCFMLHVPFHITKVIDVGGVSLWVSSVCWDTK